MALAMAMATAGGTGTAMGGAPAQTPRDGVAARRRRATVQPSGRRSSLAGTTMQQNDARPAVRPVRPARPALLLLALALGLARPDGGGGGALALETTAVPMNMFEWDDEDDKSYEVPGYLACDACGAVAWQLRHAVRRAEATQSGRRLSESQLLEILEDGACAKETFETYGLKNPEGGARRVLDGPGAEGAGLRGGRVSGGTFPNKLARRCAEIVGEFDEMELYELLGEGGGGEEAAALARRMQSEPAGGPSTPAVDEGLREAVCAGRWCGGGGGGGGDGGGVESDGAAQGGRGQIKKKKKKAHGKPKKKKAKKKTKEAKGEL
jgi:hypothetical protein